MDQYETFQITRYRYHVNSEYYISDTLIDCEPDSPHQVGIHFDAAELTEVFAAIANLDMDDIEPFDLTGK